MQQFDRPVAPGSQGAPGLEDQPVQIGGEVDAEALVGEIRADVQRKAEAGLYPPELVAELKASSDPVIAAALDVRDAAGFSALAPVTRPVRASLRYVAPGVVVTKRLIRKGLGWYTKWMVEQTHHFATTTAAAILAVADRLEEHHAELARSRERQAALERRLTRLEAKLSSLTEPVRDQQSTD